jgi:hypothetical protein
MKRNAILKILTITCALSLIAGVLPGCKNESKSSSTSNSAQATSNYFEQFNAVSATFSGIVTLANGDQTSTVFTEFFTPVVPISWMGPIFYGRYEGSGAFGGDFVFDVHGSVSADGNWVESMYFSREVIQQDILKGELLRVTLRNAPMTKSVDSQNINTAICEKSGSDVQRFIALIEYSNGLLVGTKPLSVISDFRYISTDWSSTVNKPLLKLSFVISPDQPAGGGLIGGAM